MAQQIGLGSSAVVRFALYEADGTTKRAGAAGDIATILTRNAVVSGEAVAIAEIVGAAGEYVATFTPLVVGSYTLVLRDTLFLRDYVETVQAFANDVDDVAAALAALPAAADVVLEVLNVDAVRVGVAFAPVVKFRRKSTLALFDPTPFSKAEVVNGLGEVLQTILEADIDHDALGVFSFDAAAPVAAGSVFLRFTFQLPGGGIDLIDVVRVRVAAAAGDIAAADGAPSRLERIYTCPTFLTRAGYDLAALDDIVVWDLIRSAAAVIDRYTDQWFNGEYDTWRLDGRGRPVVEHKSGIPFISIESVEVLDTRTNRENERLTETTWHRGGTGILSVDEYVNRGRALERIYSDFPGGPHNIKLVGALGWVENGREVETESTSELAEGGNFIDIEDAAGFQVRDVVDIVGEDDAVRVILTAVSRAQSRLFFDPIVGLTDAIPATALVRTFGQVPRAVETVANYLFGSLLRDRAAFVAGEEPIAPGAIKREKTDDYEIEYAINTSGDSGATPTTGSARYDQILAQYRAPCRLVVI